MMDAIRQKDVDQAEKIMYHHVKAFYDRVRNHLQSGA
jgi:DNA-binding GntR family transcriptional regulator